MYFSGQENATSGAWNYSYSFRYHGSSSWLFVLWVQCGGNCWMLIWQQTFPFILQREIRCCADTSAVQCSAQLYCLQFLNALPAWYASCFQASWKTTDGRELKSNTGHYDSIVLTKQWQSPVRVMFSPHLSLFLILPPFCGWQMWRREKSGEDSAKLILAMTDWSMDSFIQAIFTKYLIHAMHSIRYSWEW